MASSQEGVYHGTQLGPERHDDRLSEALGSPPTPADSATSRSGNDSQAGEDEASWQDIESDEESFTVVSLFDDTTFPDLKSMLAYCREKFHFDFLLVCEQLGLDFHGAVQLCNFIRGRVRDGISLPMEISPQDIDSDKYLSPVLEDDAMIFLLDDVLEQDDMDMHDSSGEQQGEGDAQVSTDPIYARERNRQLEAELKRVREQFASYRLAVEETLDRRWGNDAGPETKPKNPAYNDSEYWESYAGRDIHETMLKDKIRTDAYRDFVYGNKHLFQDKVVLDIGCGTGILSLFCARAGAKRVMAVDNSAIIRKAQENVFNNGLSNTITCISGRIEEVKLPVDKVDVIISEWMGYCLLYEAMLPSVLWARDRYLKPDGLLVPSHAAIWASPVSVEEYVEENVSFWQDVYGFNMEAMQEGMYDDARMEHMAGPSLCGEPFLVSQLDLHRTTVADLTFKSPWSTTVLRDIDALDGFLIWFDICFATSRDAELDPPICKLTATAPANATATATTASATVRWANEATGTVSFTTGPLGTETHWRQGLLLAPRVQEHHQPMKSGSELSGEMSFSAAKTDARGLQIDVTWNGSGQTRRSRSWRVR